MPTRLEGIDRRRTVLAARARRLGDRRMLVIVVALVLGAVAWKLAGDAATWGVLGLGLVVFIALGRLHDRVSTARRTWDTWRALEERHQARRERDWDHLSADHHDAVDPAHPFAGDLDLLGERSLLHLIDTTVSLGGHRRLRDWLLRTEPDLDALAARQERVASLIGARHLRRRLALAATRGLGGRRSHWDSERLATLVGNGEHLAFLRTRLAILTVLALTTAVLVVVQARLGGPPLWGLSFLVYFAVTAQSLRAVAELFDDALMLEETLEPLRRVLGWLEDRRVPPAIEDVVAPLRHSDSHRPSAMLRRVQRIAWGAALRTSQIPWILVNTVVPWDVFFGMRLEATRRELRDHLPHWLDALHELEALAALAEFADVTPGTSFPRIVDDGAVLDARALGHPLLHPAQCVTNDFAIDHTGRVFLLTGSNMSGKSTFLRSVGVNLVLANAGGPVLASSMAVRPMRIFTCIQVADSVNDGISYFYAEVRRLAALVRALDAPSPFAQISLVDEIYRGTNNRERRAGSEAFVHHLSGRGGALLLSTHDLELATLADSNEEIVNLHFREEIRDDRMEFDFLLRQGPSPTTNALRLMAREGLPVPPEV